MTRRALIYCRISQDRAGAGLGVERQQADCEALAKRLGWTVVGVHVDNDISAYSGQRRPAYRELLADLGAGRANGVIAWHTDRLHRSPRELEEFVDVCERRGVITHTVQAGELDLATPSGRAVARTLGAWSRFESEHKSERTKRAQLQAATAGKWLGGGRPFGWTTKGDGSAVLCAAEAKELRRAAAAVLGGASLGSIAADWNARGILTATGKPWVVTTLRQVLVRSRNAGLSSFGGEIVGKSIWPPILTEETWRAVRGIVEDPARRRSSSNRVKWLMAGIVQCGTCQQPMRSATVASNRARGTNRTVYRCVSPGTGHVARAAQPIDELVDAVIVARLTQPDALESLTVSKPSVSAVDMRAEAVALRQRLNEVADLYAAGELSSVQLSRITANVTEQLNAVTASMAGAGRGAALSQLLTAKDAQKAWQALSVARKRVVISELVTVTVLPTGRSGRTFNPESVRIEWRSA